MTSFVAKYCSILNFPNCHLAWHRDTKRFGWKKRSIPINLSSLSVSSTLGDTVYLVSEKYAFSSQSELQKCSCYCWFLAAILLHNGGCTNMAAPYKAWNVSKNNSETMHRTDLRIGEEISKFVSYNISSFWLFSFSRFNFIILLRDSENL